MKLPHRRQFLHLAAGAAALPALSRIAWAQAYPSRPVRIIVGLPAGSTSDIIARLMGHWLSERLGSPFVVENRPGAGTNIGTELVVRSPPDGYTLLLILAANAINVMLYDNLNFNFIRDIAPVASVMRTPGVMEVNPLVLAKTVPEFIAHAKANPGKINMGSAGNGSVSHVAGELLMFKAGLRMVHVPYRGVAPALTNLLGGQVQVVFGAVTATMPYISTGKVRALAVTGTARSELLPDIPTVGELVPGYEASAWYGIGAPKGTPVEIVDRLNTAMNESLADPKLKARLADLGATVLTGSSADLGKLIADETEKWAKVIEFAKIKAE